MPTILKCRCVGVNLLIAIFIVALLSSARVEALDEESQAEITFGGTIRADGYYGIYLQDLNLSDWASCDGTPVPDWAKTEVPVGEPIDLLVYTDGCDTSSDIKISSCNRLFIRKINFLYPLVEWDSVDKSLTKEGYPEFGTASTPPLRYLKMTLSAESSFETFSLEYYAMNSQGDVSKASFNSVSKKRTSTQVFSKDATTGVESGSGIALSGDESEYYNVGLFYYSLCWLDYWGMPGDMTMYLSNPDLSTVGTIRSSTVRSDTYTQDLLDSGYDSKADACENGYPNGDPKLWGVLGGGVNVN